MYNTARRPSPLTAPRRQDFRGNDRLKFTSAEQAAIRTAERAFGYGPQPQRRTNLLGGAVRTIVTLLILGWLAGVVIALVNIQPQRPLSTPSAMEAQVLRPETSFSELPPDPLLLQIPQTTDQPQFPVLVPPVATAPPPIMPETPSQLETLSPKQIEPGTALVSDDQPQPELETPQFALEGSPGSSSPQANREAETATKLEFQTSDEMREALATSGHLDEFQHEIEERRWTEVKAETDTWLLEEPRFDAAVVTHIPYHHRYYAIDTHLPCSRIAGITWKVAWVKLPDSEPRLGLVCTPEPLRAKRKGRSFLGALGILSGRRLSVVSER